MPSKFRLHCCDPIELSQEKTNASGGSYNLRCVPISLIAKFPSLQLTNKHKICPSRPVAVKRGGGGGGGGGGGTGVHYPGVGADFVPPDIIR